MRKVTKILLKLLSLTLLFLIFCPIVLTLVLSLPSVQNYVVDRATEFVSEKLQPRVEIGRIRIGALGSLRVDDFYVEDYQQDTLLYAGRVKVFLTGVPEKSGVTLRNGILSDVKLNLRETPSGEINIKQVVDGSLVASSADVIKTGDVVAVVTNDDGTKELLILDMGN